MAQFYPLNHVGFSVKLFESEETCTENKKKQGAWLEMPSEKPVWKQGIRADFSGLSEGEKRSFTDLLEEYGDLFAVGDGNLGRTHF